MRSQIIRRAATIMLGTAALLLGLITVAGPAQAFESPNLGGQVAKFKTIWGGGFALNIGRLEGDTTNGARPIVHHNRRWDSPNRWVVEWQWQEPGFTGNWYRFRNLWSNQCLSTVSPASNVVEQRPCTDWDNRQWWGQWLGTSPISGGRPIRNLDNTLHGSSRMLTQAGQFELANVTMEPFSFSTLQYWTYTNCTNAPDC